MISYTAFLISIVLREKRNIWFLRENWPACRFFEKFGGGPGFIRRGGGFFVNFCPIRQQLNRKKWPKMAIFDYIFTM